MSVSTWSRGASRPFKDVLRLGLAYTSKGAGVDGRMSFHDGLIDVSVRLGLLASMFEPVIRNEVQTYLDNHVT